MILSSLQLARDIFNAGIQMVKYGRRDKDNAGVIKCVETKTIPAF